MDARSESKATLFVDDENEGKSVAVAKDVVSKLVPTTPSSTTTQTQFELKSESEEEVEQGMKTLGSHTTDVEDHAAKVSVEEQMQITTINREFKMDERSKTDSNSKATLFLDDEIEGKSLRMLFAEEDDSLTDQAGRRLQTPALLLLLRQISKEEGIVSGSGDSFGANCWFD